MINKILNNAINVSLGKQDGKFLADKSYAFDTIFFIAKFILHNSVNNQINKQALRKKSIEYIEDIFQLKKGTAGAVNYFLETINFLEFSNVLVKINHSTYLIKEREILEYITETPENAYIFTYLITYQTFKNDNLLPLFDKYCYAKNTTEKSVHIKDIYKEFCRKSVSIKEEGTQWSKQLVKYAFTVLGYINNQNKVTRELVVKDEKLSVSDISLNVSGTRTPIYLPKKNDYLQNFNRKYVKYYLQRYLFIEKETIPTNDIIIINSVAQSLADLKLTMLDDVVSNNSISDYEKEQYIVNMVKTRNQSVQHQFRKALLDNNVHRCPICGFCFEDFLIASHIKPYSKCEDTYDAINQYNGFLMCPNHDRLFEGAKHMTIDAISGEIILSPTAANSQDFGNLKGKFIPKTYIENERRHYLKWHNERFNALK